ncbi:MAG: tRNA (guanosine(37)-N1)-methyltransferase TrmD [Clostridiaceae bacterium]|jgi:tRNA (guanine37-N1)-methyltransferase|nr:tRNA (guanosine(37)-N1)-methyltransferase TrmD [Clostridiaceae bacterium]
MRFDILTIFPEIFDAVLGSSITGRARDNGLITFKAWNIRDYTKDKHKKTDDYPYGGGSGLVMMAQPIYDAYEAVVRDLDHKPHFIYMSPQGKRLDQKLVEKLSEHRHIILLCGHYEGVDERVLEKLVDEEISIGDYVLTGGELPAMVLIDAVSRTIPGVLSNKDSYADESHKDGLLEYPQYTRPYDFRGMKVPDILLSGHHANIEKWRRLQSLKRTRDKRPDLFEKLELSEEDKKLLAADTESML